MTTIEQHREVARKAQDAIYKIEIAERRATSEALVGKAFKYRNSYSCPEKPGDYWWMYVKIKSVSSDGHVIAEEFQIDKYGDITIRFKTRLYNHMSGYQRIPMSEYRRAFKAMQAKIGKCQP